MTFLVIPTKLVLAKAGSGNPENYVSACLDSRNLEVTLDSTYASLRPSASTGMTFHKSEQLTHYVFPVRLFNWLPSALYRARFLISCYYFSVFSLHNLLFLFCLFHKTYFPLGFHIKRNLIFFSNHMARILL